MIKRLKRFILDFNAADTGVKSNGKAIGATTAVVAASAASSSMVYAAGGGISGLFSKIKDLLKQVYDGVDAIITGATVVVIGIGFLIRILSKNQRTVDEATTWIKRAVMTLIVWKFLGLFMGTIDDTAQGEGYNWQ